MAILIFPIFRIISNLPILAKAHPAGDKGVSCRLVQPASGSANSADDLGTTFGSRRPLPGSWVSAVGSVPVRFLLALQGLGAFGLISLGVLVSKAGVARSII